MKTYTIPCLLLPQNFNETVLLEWLVKWFKSSTRPPGKYCIRFEFPFHDWEYFYILNSVSFNLGKGWHDAGFHWKCEPVSYTLTPVIKVWVTVPQ